MSRSFAGSITHLMPKSKISCFRVFIVNLYRISNYSLCRIYVFFIGNLAPVAVKVSNFGPRFRSKIL